MIDTINFGFRASLLVDGTTPREVGILKDVSVEFSSTSKELRGSKTFPVAVATSAQKIVGKAASGTFDGALLASILGATVTTGSKKITSEPHAAALSVTVTNALTFKADLGVTDAAGKAMTKVATAPTAGQYAVSEATGVYTFAAGETGTLTINYQHTLTTGSTATITLNKAQAAPTTFKLHLFNDYNGNKGLTLFAAVIPKVSLAMKGEEFTESGLDIECYADASGDVAEMVF